MDFAQILDEWEKGQYKKGVDKEMTTVDDKNQKVFEKWIDSEENWKHYDKGNQDKDVDLIARREYLRKLEPEDEIDLHGLTLEQSLSQLDRFLKEALSRGLQKVLIIHGKGHHSKGKAVLPKAVLELLQESPIAGEIGTPKREKGGSGATWVIIKHHKNGR